MGPIVEYLVVSYHFSMGPSPNPMDPNSLPQTWSANYQIRRPGADVEKRVVDPNSADASWVALINELGADQWNLVESTTIESVAVQSSHGWGQGARIPSELRHIFMREK
jgi:hypothetical protein